MPAVYQGTAFRPGDSPILHLERPENFSAAEQTRSLSLLNSLNQKNALQYARDTELQARNRSYEQAARIEAAAPEAVDINKESDATKELYGLNDEITKGYGTNLLRARRLVERGVRFVQVMSGELGIRGENRTWDAHNKPRQTCKGSG